MTAHPAARGTRGQDYTGPSWRQPSWYLARVDRHRQLGHHERAEAAAEACRRTCAAADVHPDRDPYELARAAVAEVRHEHQADDREPIPHPAPLDLDALAADVHLMGERSASDPMRPTPGRA